MSAIVFFDKHHICKQVILSKFGLSTKKALILVCIIFSISFLIYPGVSQLGNVIRHLVREAMYSLNNYVDAMSNKVGLGMIMEDRPLIHPTGEELTWKPPSLAMVVGVESVLRNLEKISPMLVAVTSYRPP